MNKTIRNTFACLAAFMAIGMSNAQETGVFFGKTPQSISPEGKIRCLSYEYNQYLRESKPELYLDNDAVNPAKVLRTIDQTDDVIYTVPVVVHVIHSGQAVGVGANISDAQILSQIEVLNQDYRRMMGTPGYNTDPVGADTGVQFCLAKTDPYGNPTTGINRIQKTRSSWTSEYQITSEIQNVHRWDPNKYYNIYVVNFGGGLNGVLGYAMLPNIQAGSGLQGLSTGVGSAADDGFVVGYKYFGSKTIYPGGTYDSTFNRGRTATHEMGHALGLHHIWGDSSNCDVDDYCADTPPQNSENYGCPTNAYSCNSADMYRNYMDYTDDSCMNIFTNDQKYRIRTVMQYGHRRASLLTSTVCNEPLAVERFDLDMIKLYPNPANDYINLTTSDNWTINSEVVIYNSVGQKVFTAKVGETSLYTINTSDFASGVYFVKINREGGSKTLQFIKK